jgi:hypothetical protein
MNSVETLKEAITGVKFTPAQKAVVSKLLDGWIIVVVNRHYLNGGEYMWRTPYSENLQHAGKVYKAFWNVFYEIKRQKGIKVETNLFIV